MVRTWFRVIRGLRASLQAARPASWSGMCPQRPTDPPATDASVVFLMGLRRRGRGNWVSLDGGTSTTHLHVAWCTVRVNYGERRPQGNPCT